MKERIENKIFYGGLLLLVSLGLFSCSVSRFIPEEEQLYTGAGVELNSQDEIQRKQELQTELENLLQPEPNSKFLGMRIGLYFHYKAQQEKPGFINKFLAKKIGEEPVYLSEVEPFETENLIKNRLENRGYFYSRVSHRIEEDTTSKQASIVYKAILPEEPYVVENYTMDNDSLPIYQRIERTLQNSVIQPGTPFNLDLLKQERSRIDDVLKSDGYYNFSPNFLIFEADTNQYDRKKFDLFLRLKEDVPQEGIKPYVVQSINVYPNYSVEMDSVQWDTVRYNGKNYLQNTEFFKPKKLDPFILLKEGERYDPVASGKTSRRLTSLGTYKLVNIRYEEIDSLATDSLGYLQAHIFLSPLTKRAIRAELQAVTKSNNFAGPHLALTYSNRNLFHGGEILSLTGKVGYERQLGSGSDKGLSSTQLGLDADFVYPRMLFPLSVNYDWFKYSIPKTKIGAGFEYLNRQDLFSLFSVTGSFGYIWKANRFITHELNPFSVNYLQLGKTTPAFTDILKNNPYLQTSFDQQFIAGMTYSFVYNGMVDLSSKHQFSIFTNLDLAGNVLDLLSNGATPKKFLGLNFAQYVRVDGDFRYHYNFKPEHTLATRLFAGIGIPYGNSEIMPFSRQYYAGGPYSVRAFQIRRLGPGSHNPDEGEGTDYFDQVGNIRLEANLEYRFPVYQFLKGAVFTDAGNIWNSRPYNIPEGEFESDFISELGIGVGAGLRIDIQSFVIRFDLAFPVHTPWLEDQPWDFRFKDPVLNFGIGYPF